MRILKPKCSYFEHSVAVFSHGIEFTFFTRMRQSSHKICAHHYFSRIWLPFFVSITAVYVCIFCIFILAMSLYVARAAAAARPSSPATPTKRTKWICVASLMPPQHWLNFIHSLAPPPPPLRSFHVLRSCACLLLLSFFLPCCPYVYICDFGVYYKIYLCARFHNISGSVCYCDVCVSFEIFT